MLTILKMSKESLLNVLQLEDTRYEKYFQYLIIFWFISMPFGSHIGSVSFGGFTLYPNLILTVLIFPFAVFTTASWPKSLKNYSLILLVLVVYAISWGVINERNDEWKFDVRSLSMQFLYAVNIFGAFTLLGKRSFTKLVGKGVLFFFLLLVVTGFFEYYTGIHFAGNATNKFFDIDEVIGVFYAPLFLFDNPNNYLVYLFLLLLLTIILFEKVRNNYWVLIASFLLVYIFSDAADSKLTVFLSVGIIIVLLGIILIKQRKEWLHKSKIYLVFGVLGIIILLFNKPLFYGPKFIKMDWNQQFSQNVELKDNCKETEELNSTSIRLNLIKIGVNQIQKQPVIGLGPGQFRHRILKGEEDIPIGTVINPHNYVIEMISQYGVFGWVYFLFLLVAFLSQIKKVYHTKQGFWLLAFFVLYGCLSTLPSSFLGLDINWISIPILLIFVYEDKEELNA